ncbi:MAG: phenylalanine--tRNA ligase subunit beta [Fimbriimonadaceae bacterium]|nr:phenylalanine--tRNA ligase subunit beta [Fimbriimonadaceae bacterium]QYK55606.1 MAG: phenylalanine--tRNA ligase subunit beta [Fimbriimonadaceae bacterium]
MKLTESMIRDMVDTTMTAEEIGDLLTMVGFEIEEITEQEGEKVLDINIMANRGDGASSLGIAREILAKSSEASPTKLYQWLTTFEGPTSDDLPQSSIAVSIQTPACSRFACQEFSEIQNGPSPEWLQERLRRIGQRPISLLVDLTNYVMIETGQPLHAYDMAKLTESTIVVREARPGETVKTLDETERTLPGGALVIADESRPIGVAGVMGGFETEVDGQTTRCLLEAAHFDHQRVRQSRKSLKLQTDASYRFERYVDPNGPIRAIARFAQILAETGEGAPSSRITDEYPAPPKRHPITLTLDRASARLGMPVHDKKQIGYLRSLGCQVVETAGSMQVVPPTWRIDLIRSDDLVEEIGRMHGYEKIPEALPHGFSSVGGVHGLYAFIDQVQERFLRLGFDQAMSHSMTSKSPLDAPLQPVEIRQPHSPELAFLRTSLLPGLADTFARNDSHNQLWFETGRVFSEGKESLSLGLLATGRLNLTSWNHTSEDIFDFYTFKACVLEGLDPHLSSALTLKLGNDPRLHPTRQAALGKYGILGQVHPTIAAQTGLPAMTFLAEIDLEAAFAELRKVPSYRPIFRNPPARRDVALLVPESVSYHALSEAITLAGGSSLEHYELFDAYKGQGVPQGHVSYAITLQFRKDGNFTDAEANLVRDEIVKALQPLGVSIR